MASFSTKTRAIILSTLLICNKYSAIGDKITFFEPVYANDTNAKKLKEGKFEELKYYISSIDQGLTTNKTIEPHELAQARTNLQHMKSIVKDYIDHNQIVKLDEDLAKKRIRDRTPRKDLHSDIERTVKRIEDNNKQICQKDAENLYFQAGRFIQKLENKSKNDSTSADSTLGSIRSYQSDLVTNNDQHAQVVPEERTPEIPNVDAIAPQAIEPHGVETQAELQGTEPNLLNEQDNNDNDNISDSKADDNAPEASTTTSSNYSDNQTQSSDSDTQSTTEDDVESDTNNDDFTTALRPVSNNNTAMIHDTDDNNHGHFTPIFHSTIYKARTLVFPQISRKVSSDRTTQQVIGASCSSNLKILKRYELEAKYLYSTTTTPKTNGSSKSNIHGLLINLKRQMTSKFTAGVFYSPTITNTTISTENNNNNTSGCMDHLFGAYTSYAITPVTYLSNQIALGITAADNNKSSNEKHHNYFIFDSFISHKINIDATKIVSPELGISYYQSNSHIPSNVGEIKNLSLSMGVKLQYKYKYNNFDLCPSIKINHVHPLYANITGNIKDLSNRGDTPSIDLLRDLQSAFDPHSSIRFALSVRHKSIRFESGYGFTTYHNIEHSYAHTFFAKLNLSL